MGLGGNTEDTLGALSAARIFLTDLLDLPSFSSLYQTAPQLDTNQPDFWNAVVLGGWSGSPEGLLERLLMWEAGVGRRRDPLRPKGPRVIDLDLLVFGEVLRGSPRLHLPHPGLPFRRFALEPLVEVAPGSRDPASGRLWKTILDGLMDQGVDRSGRTW